MTKRAAPVKAGPQGAMLLAEAERERPCVREAAAGDAAGAVMGKSWATSTRSISGAGASRSSPRKDVTTAARASDAVAFDDIYSHAPPMIDVAPAALATRDDKVKVTGDARAT